MFISLGVQYEEGNNIDSESGGKFPSGKICDH